MAIALITPTHHSVPKSTMDMIMVAVNDAPPLYEEATY